MSQTRYLTIHGHFYQPPRENPWTGEIEIQKSAAPSHDWNERILKECYDPNAHSRVLNGEGKIEDQVNNYAHMNFNMGPTLLNWIRFNHPDTYERIVQADKDSCERLEGRGNALAQVYNHIIMPLASPHDRVTQIEWGLKDFEYHFGRPAESIWLAETAINMDVVVDLIQAGVKYVIMAPTQFEAFREINTDSPYENTQDWSYQAPHEMDTHQAYRIYPRNEKGQPICEGYLDAFFYDGPLSTAVSFENILKDANVFGDRIAGSFQDQGKPELLSIATDGESYGHHDKFGDMCLAYFFDRIAKKKNIEVVSYAWYLENHPPVLEAKLRNEHNEGTAWSCAHGVGRWYRDCGCATGGEADWNQKWRTPLRDALDFLKNKLDEIFVQEMKLITDIDPWDIRNQYVEVLIQNDLKFTEQWVESRLSVQDENVGSKMLGLLEMQKFGMYMYTSCGWFFNDFEGIEPVQNLKYARRAIELLENFTQDTGETETQFLLHLRKAVTNESKIDGEALYLREAVPRIQPEYRLIAGTLFNKSAVIKSCVRKIQGDSSIRAEIVENRSHVLLWKVSFQEISTWMTRKYWAYEVETESGENIVVFYPGDYEHEDLPAIDKIFKNSQAVLKAFSTGKVIRLHNLYPDDLKELLDRQTFDAFEDLCAEFIDFRERHHLMVGLMTQQKVDLPDYIATPLKMSHNAKIHLLLKDLLVTNDAAKVKEIRSLMEQSNEMGFKIDLRWIEKQFEERLLSLIPLLCKDSDIDDVQHVSTLFKLIEWTGMSINKSKIEDTAFPLYRKFWNSKVLGKSSYDFLAPLFAWMNFHIPTLDEELKLK